MSKLFLVLLIATVVCTVSSQRRRCGRNEEWNNCGTACPETCDGKPDICTMQCVIGCQCKAGYVRDSWGDCIRRQDCP